MRLTMSRVSPDRITLTVEGEVDLAVADDLRQAGCDALTAYPDTLLQIQLTDVTLMESSALNSLIAIRNAAAGPVVLIAPSRRWPGSYN